VTYYFTLKGYYRDLLKNLLLLYYYNPVLIIYYSICAIREEFIKVMNHQSAGLAKKLGFLLAVLVLIIIMPIIPAFAHGGHEPPPVDLEEGRRQSS